MTLLQILFWSFMHFRLYLLILIIDLDALKENDSLESSLRTHQASWHTSCYSKINTTKLKRLKGKKRQSSNENIKQSPKKIYTRYSVSFHATVQESSFPVCFF